MKAKRILSIVTAVCVIASFGAVTVNAADAEYPIGYYNIAYPNRSVIFATDGGSYIKPVEQPYRTSLNIENFVPVKEGYDFDGWYSDPQTKENRVTEFTFNESDTVYAKWTPNGTAVYKAPVVQRVYATDDEVLAFGNYIDEKTGVPVTAQWVEQNKRLNELMEIYNEKFRK